MKKQQLILSGALLFSVLALPGWVMAAQVSADREVEGAEMMQGGPGATAVAVQVSANHEIEAVGGVRQDGAEVLYGSDAIKAMTSLVLPDGGVTYGDSTYIRAPMLHLECHRDDMFMSTAYQLELHGDQQAQLEAYRQAVQEDCAAQSKRAEALRKQLREAVDSGADKSILDDIGVQLGRLEVARAETAHLFQQEFLAVLTEEQKARFARLKADFKDRRRRASLTPYRKVYEIGN